jgi:hypothetical protein
MALEKDDLASDIYKIFQKGESDEIDDVYHSARMMVDAIYDYISSAEIKIKTPGIHISSGASDPKFKGGRRSITLSIANFEEDNTRIALEASFVAAYNDPGSAGMGQPGFKIFCKGATKDDEIQLWQDAIDHIEETDIRELWFDPKKIKDDYESGYSFFISTLVNWTDANYAAAAAVTKMIEINSSDMFSMMKEKMEENKITASDAEDAATDIAYVIHDATIGSTVTSIFASVDGFVQPSAETVSIE